MTKLNWGNRANILTLMDEILHHFETMVETLVDWYLKGNQIIRLWVKIGTQNVALVNGTKDLKPAVPDGVMLTRTHSRASWVVRNGFRPSTVSQPPSASYIKPEDPPPSGRLRFLFVLGLGRAARWHNEKAA